MICKGKWNRHLCMLMTILGTASFLFGLLTFLIGRPEGSHINTLMGMFTGFGAGILGVAAYQLLRSKLLSREKQEQQEIDRQDERNIAITRTACTVAYYAAIVLMAVLTFLFMGLGYRAPAYICLGGLYVLAGVFFVARKVLEKRM